MTRTVLILALSPTLAWAGSFYVNDATATNDLLLPGCTTAPLGANVAGCGTCLTPCLSPSYLYANTPLTAGDVVFLNAGTYSAGTAVPVLSVDNPARAGTASAPLTFRGVLEASGKPLTLFDGNNVATAGVQVLVSWISIENIAVTRFACTSGSTAPFGSGIQVGATPLVGVTLVNLEVYGTVCSFGAPIDFDSTANPCTGCKIVGCTIHDNGATAGGIYTNGAAGLQILGNVISGNTLTNAGFPAIVISNAPNVVIEGNLVYGNGGSGLSISKSGGGPASTNVVVRGNTFWGNQLASTGSSVAEIAASQQSSVTIVNNIVGATKTSCIDVDANSSFVRSDYNDLFVTGAAKVGTKGGSGAATLPLWQAASLQDANSISADPLFVSATNFHLKSVAGRPGPPGARVFDAVSSPAIDLADPVQPVGAEPAPNGGRANLGFHGGTVEASLTPVVLAKVRGDGQVGPAGVQLSVPLEIRLTSAPSLVEPGIAVSFAVGPPDAGVVSTATGVTDAFGKASTFFTPGPGSNSVVVSLVGVGATPVTFTSTGTLSDAGAVVDAGLVGVVDAGAVLDAGPGGSPDAGNLLDAGIVGDAGSAGDAGSLADSGVVVDAGLAVDAGALLDAGSIVDAGIVVDAGVEVDAGLVGDAGSLVDGGGVVDAGNLDPDGGSTDAGAAWAPVVDLGCGCSSGGGPSLVGVLLLLYRSRWRRP